MREPRIPEGPTERVAWMRHLVEWVRWMSVKEITGFRKRESSTGTSWIPTNQSTDDSGGGSNIPRWG